jgi:hypothetical protein
MNVNCSFLPYMWISHHICGGQHLSGRKCHLRGSSDHQWGQCPSSTLRGCICLSISANKRVVSSEAWKHWPHWLLMESGSPCGQGPQTVARRVISVCSMGGSLPGEVGAQRPYTLPLPWANLVWNAPRLGKGPNWGPVSVGWDLCPS